MWCSSRLSGVGVISFSWRNLVSLLYLQAAPFSSPCLLLAFIWTMQFIINASKVSAVICSLFSQSCQKRLPLRQCSITRLCGCVIVCMHVPLRIFSCIKVVPKRNYHNHNDQFTKTHWEYSMRERTMNLKMYSRALRVRRMGSQCSPRLDTSRYLFNTDISFLEENDMRERYLIYLKWIKGREREEERKKTKSQRKNKEKKEERNQNHSARIVISLWCTAGWKVYHQLHFSLL